MGGNEIDQHARLGLVSRKDLITKKVDPNLVDYRVHEGSLIAVHRGVYRFRGAPDSFESRALALTMYAGLRSAISHFSAAYLHGLEGFEKPERLELLIPHGLRSDPTGALIHRTRERFQIYKCNDIIPTTTLARTLIDLAEHLSPRDLECALNAAWRKQRNIASWLRFEIAKLQRKDWRGRDTLLAFVNRMGPRGLDSDLEVDVSRILEATDLPPPTRGLIIRDENRKRVIRGDFGWEKFKTVLHCDSVAFHSTERAMVRNAEQRSKLSLMKWTQIIVMKRSVNDPGWVSQLRQAIKVP